MNLRVKEKKKNKAVQNSKALQVLTTFDSSARTSAVESMLLSPIQGVANRATLMISTTISQTGEYILRSPPRKSKYGRKPRARYQSQAKAEDREDDYTREQRSPRRIAVDIEPRFDGTGIELIASAKAKDFESCHSYVRGSLLMFDTIVAASEAKNVEMVPMNLKILRGKNLKFDHSKIRIGVLSEEGGEVDQIIGSTPSSQGSHEPIWGSRISSWTLNANHSTKLLFTLIPENLGPKDMKGNKNKNSPKTICAIASVSELLLRRNPNFWISMRDQDNPRPNAKKYGLIQVRLTLPTQARLHKQENCLRITPGPGIPRMQSYDVRKMALYSCSPVMLNIYDVSRNPRIQTLNNTTKTIGYGGIFHAAIEIHGKEYSFGGTINRKSKISGVFQCAPKKCPMHHYRESVFLGDCELDSQQVQGILTALRPKWIARSYNVFRKNCAFFSREFAIELGVGDIPEWVFSLASTAEPMEPILNKISAYLINRTKVVSPARKSFKKTGKSAKMQKSPKEASIKYISTTSNANDVSHESIEAQEVAKNTQEALLDHAMAARIQRSFRAAICRRAAMRRAKALRNLQPPMIACA